MLLPRKDRLTLARTPGLLLLGCLLIPGLTRADSVICTQTGPNTIQIAEPGLVPGLPEPLTEVNACMLPAGFATPTVDASFDLTEPNPSNLLLPVSDYFDVTALGLVTFTSDPLDIGLPSRLIATTVPEVGSEGSNGATIVVAGVTYNLISDSPGGGGTVPEPSSMLLMLTGAALLGVSRYYKNRKRIV